MGFFLTVLPFVFGKLDVTECIFFSWCNLMKIKTQDQIERMRETSRVSLFIVQFLVKESVLLCNQEKKKM